MAAPAILLLVSLAIGRSAAASVAGASARTATGANDLCDSEIYCDGPLLRTVQLAWIFNDSKTFVDLTQLYDTSVIVDNFNTLMRATNNSPNRTQVATFVAENFAMQDELDNVTLPDWQENPIILKSIRDPLFREWAKSLNGVWRKLARRMTDEVSLHPQRHSLIYVNNTFVIPGGRFREFYYWDSYWIIEGLLLCGMRVTAKGMIENLLGMVQRYGFVPNGGRVYYLSRSQPPMLIPMVRRYYSLTGDEEFLRKHIATLEMEFEYWQTRKTVDVAKNGRTYRMARYVVNSNGPRPESYKEDYWVAQQLPAEQQQTLYDNLKTAAESGWDFSFRWCIISNESANLSLLNISTSDIIPVELNAILEMNARTLASFYRKLRNLQKVWRYNRIAASYQAAIDNVLWNEAEGAWFDYDTRNKRLKDDFYPSNLSPLYTMSYNQIAANRYALKAVSYLKRNNIGAYPGGTPTSLNYTGEQWDFPNAWPPLQSFLILGLHQTRHKEAMDLASTLAGRWLRSNYIGYEEYGKMFEKYNAIRLGEGGNGGEYNVQEGFGWTNGIVFQLLAQFPNVKYTDDAGDGVDR